MYSNGQCNQLVQVKVTASYTINFTLILPNCHMQVSHMLSVLCVTEEVPVNPTGINSVRTDLYGSVVKPKNSYH